MLPTTRSNDTALLGSQDSKRGEYRRHDEEQTKVKKRLPDMQAQTAKVR
jgi:hypothetical protein